MDELDQAIAVLVSAELKDERSTVQKCRDALKAALAALVPADKLA